MHLYLQLIRVRVAELTYSLRVVFIDDDIYIANYTYTGVETGSIMIINSTVSWICTLMCISIVQAQVFILSKHNFQLNSNYYINLSKLLIVISCNWVRKTLRSTNFWLYKYWTAQTSNSSINYKWALCMFVLCRL